MPRVALGWVNFDPWLDGLMMESQGLIVFNDGDLGKLPLCSWMNLLKMQILYSSITAERTELQIYYSISEKSRTVLRCKIWVMDLEPIQINLYYSIVWVLVIYIILSEETQL